MRVENHEHTVALEKKHQKNLFLVLASSGVTIALLVCALIYLSFTSTTIKLVPPVIAKPMTIGRNYVDEGYLSQLAEYAIWCRFNVQPETVKRNYGQLLALASPMQYPLLRPVLKKEMDIIEKEKIASAFFIKKTQVNTETGEVLVSGLLQKYVKSRALPLQSLDMLVTFKSNGGMFTLDGITQLNTKE